MRTGLILTVLGFLTLATSSAWCDETPKFDDVVVLDVPGWGRMVYVIVLTDQPLLIAELDKIVIRYAKPALQEATKHKLTGTPTADPKSKLRGNVAFAVRVKGSYPGVEYNISGFDVGQLQEIVAAK